MYSVELSGKLVEINTDVSLFSPQGPDKGTLSMLEHANFVPEDNNMIVIKEGEALLKKDRHIKNHGEWYELLAKLVFWARLDVEQEMSC